jgi:hypothetical protein
MARGRNREIYRATADDPEFEQSPDRGRIRVLCRYHRNQRLGFLGPATAEAFTCSQCPPDRATREVNQATLDVFMTIDYSKGRIFV